MSAYREHDDVTRIRRTDTVEDAIHHVHVEELHDDDESPMMTQDLELAETGFGDETLLRHAQRSGDWSTTREYYPGSGLLRSVKTGGRFTRDARGRVIRRDSPEGSVEVEYDDVADAAAHVREFVPDGKVRRWRPMECCGAELSRVVTSDKRHFSLAYEADGRIRRIDNGHDAVDFTYDAAGHLVAMRAGTSTLTVEYAPDGEVTRVNGPRRHDVAKRVNALMAELNGYVGRTKVGEGS